MFYLNRVFGFLLTKALNIVLWKFSKTYVSIESISVSLLGGKVDLKNVSFVTQDFTISLIKASFNWKFWLLHPSLPTIFSKKEGYSESAMIQGSRNVFHVEGFEIFIYNRSAAYINIIKEYFSKEENAELQKQFPDLYKNFLKLQEDENYEVDTATSFDQKPEVPYEEALNTLSPSCKWMLKCLPVAISVKLGALVLGSINTPSVLVFHWKSSESLVDAQKSENPLDKLKFKITTTHLDSKVVLKPNPLYESDNQRFKSSMYRKIVQSMKNASDFILRHRFKNKKFHPEEIVQQWKGLPMYTEIEDDTVNELENEAQMLVSHQNEYAKFSKVLECDKVIHTYSFDIAGKVSSKKLATSTEFQGPDIGNGGSPPDHRLDLQFFEAHLYYGPWANRQLAPIIKVLSPQITRDHKKKKVLLPGFTRLATRFQLFIDISSKSTLRIPTREFSKDNLFLKNYSKTKNVVRPFGWIDIDLNTGSSAFFDFTFFPIGNNYVNTFNVDLMTPTIYTSVNHDIFFRAAYHNFTAQSFCPLKWNETVKWQFDQISNDSEVFLLREHVTLLLDMFQDFSFAIDSGSFYDLYRACEYHMSWRFKETYKIHVNVNDANVINIATDFNENSYVTFCGDSSVIKAETLLNNIAALSTEIFFNIDTPLFQILLNTPTWSTISNFISGREVGRSANFLLNGTYKFFHNVDIGNVDQLVLECESDYTTILLYGFVIKYFDNLRANIVGKFKQYKTSEEFQEAQQEISTGESLNFSRSFRDSDAESFTDTIISEDSEASHFGNEAAVKKSELRRTSNETDIWITFSVNDGHIFLPENLYDSSSCLGIHFPFLSSDLRNLDFYFDMKIEALPVFFKRHIFAENVNVFDAFDPTNLSEIMSENDGRLENIFVHGHKFYGVPPDFDLYMTRWDMSIGKLYLDSDLSFYKCLYQAFSKMEFSSSDVENTLVYETSSLDTVEFCSFEIAQVDLRVREADTVFAADIKDIMISARDPDNTGLSKKFTVNVNEITCRFFAKEVKVFELATALNFTNFEIPIDFEAKLKKQRGRLLLEDAPYHRCWFLLPKELREKIMYSDLIGSVPSTSSIPSLVTPFTADTADYIIDGFLKDDMHLRDYLFNETEYDQPDSIKSTATGHSTDVPFFDNSFANMTKREISNAVWQIEKTTVLFDICGLGKIIQFLDTLSETSCENIADSIQMNVVSPLATITKMISTDFKMNVESKGICVSLKNSAFDPDTSLILNFSNLSYMSKETKIFNQAKSRWQYEYEKSSACTFDNCVIRFDREDLKNVIGHPRSFRIILDSFEFLSDCDSIDVSNFSLGTIKVQMNSASNEILFQMAKASLNSVSMELPKLKRVVERVKTQKREFILQLLKASVKYEINYDPPVITKLSNIVKLSKSHVRDNPSWRMSVRIRHILKHVPPGWEDNMMSILANNRFTPLEKASDDFVGIFKKWKNFEQRESCDTYLYHSLFLGESSFKPITQDISKVWSFSLEKLLLTNALLDPLDEDTIFVKSFEFKYSDYFQHLPNTNTNIDKESDLVAASIDHAFLAKIGRLKANLGLPLLETLNLYQSLMGETVSKQEAEVQAQSESLLNFLNDHCLFMVDSLDFSFNIDAKSIHFRSFGNNGSLMKTAEGGSMALSYMNFDFFLKYHNSILLHYGIQKGSVYYGFLDDVEGKAKRKIDFFGDDVILQSREDVKKGLHILDSFIASFKKLGQDYCSPVSKKEDTTSMENLEDVWVCSLVLTDIQTSLSIFSPFRVEQNVEYLETSLSLDDVKKIEVLFRNANATVASSSTKQTYFLHSQSEFAATFLPSSNSADSILHDVAVRFGLIKNTIFDLRDIGKSLSADLSVFTSTVSTLKTFLIKHELIDPESDLGFLFDLAVRIDYLGVLFDFKSYELIVEVEDITAGVKNFIEEAHGTIQILDFLWYLFIDSFKMSVKDPHLPIEYTRVLNFAISASVSREVVNELSSLEIKSKYFRVCLVPQSFIRVFWIYEQFMNFMEQCKLTRKTSFEKIAFEKGKLKQQQQQQQQQQPKPIEFTSRFKNVQCLAYDFCIGWLYGEPTNIYTFDDKTDSGLIIGFEKLFSAHNKTLGKLTVCNSYTSVSFGESYKDFYGLRNDKTCMNKTCLPNIQVAYWLTKNDGSTHDLNLKMWGDLLQITLAENVVDVTQRVTKSFLRVQKLKNYILKGFSKNAKPSETLASGESLKNIGIRQVNCSVNYAGGHCCIYSNRDILSGAPPTVSLTSPEVDFKIKYDHQPDCSFVHAIRVLIKVGKAQNVLFPKCVPVFHQMVKDFQGLLTLLGPDHDVREPVSPTSAKNMDYNKLLEKFDIALTVEFEKQDLSMSCEPKAKIKAVFGFEHILLNAFTSNEDPLLSFSVSLNIGGLSSKFQHIFSKNVSSSFSIANLNTVFLVSHKDYTDVYAITKSDKLKIFLDFNQFEDLMLFFDIWTPHSLLSSTNEEIEVDQKKNFLDKPKTYAVDPTLAWNYIIIFDDTQGKFDLGPSLGVLTFSSSRVSASLNQFIDWRKKLSLDIEDLTINSEGRLSGFVSLTEFNWTSEIKWDRGKGHRFTPLVYLSCSLGNIRTKISLDYHIFLIAHICQTKLTVFNTQDLTVSTQGLLAASLDCDKVELFSTILTTSNILNIYDTVTRIKMDNRMSYFETLRDSNTKTLADHFIDKELENYISSLKTDLSVNLGELYVQVFEHTLTDTDVLVIRNDNTRASMSTKGKQKIATQLEMFTNKLTVKVSSNEFPIKDKDLAHTAIEDYMKMAKKAHGGTLVNFPSINIQMTTWQNVGSNIIELLYSSEFGGMVSIKWNLRPVNFIRDMWAAHAVTLSQRHEELLAAKEEEKSEETSSERGATSFFEEKDLDNKIKNVDLGDKYVYQPLAEPHIETPQIKDLGGATPPLEWFGVNRNRFPGMVHQVIIVPLQHVIAQSERQYGSALSNL
ncbi:hypothetical protein ACO0QE_002787 [Hanseniaspora vineae]